jgi:hypothetical protein
VLNDVNRLAQALERETKQLHPEDIISTKLWVDHFKSKNISVFYKDNDTLCPGVRPMGCQMFVRLKTSYYGVLF